MHTMFPENEYLGTLANDNYLDYFEETDMVDKYRLICSLVLNIYRIFQNDTQRQTLHVYKLWLFGK